MPNLIQPKLTYPLDSELYSLCPTSAASYQDKLQVHFLIFAIWWFICYDFSRGPRGHVKQFRDYVLNVARSTLDTSSYLCILPCLVRTIGLYQKHQRLRCLFPRPFFQNHVFSSWLTSRVIAIVLSAECSTTQFKLNWAFHSIGAPTPRAEG